MATTIERTPTAMRARAAWPLFAALPLLASTGAALAQQEPSLPGTVPIETLIANVAAETGYTFFVDPRVRAQATVVGRNTDAIGYEDLLAILQLHGFAAVRTGETVRIVPDAVVRSLDLPVLAARDNPSPREVVSKVLNVRNVPASTLVPVLRPLVPVWGHLAAFTCSNTLIIVDTFANVRRIEEVIAAVDVGERYEPRCEPMPAPPPPPQPVRSGPDGPDGAPPPPRR